MQALLHRKHKVFYYHNFLLVFQTQTLEKKMSLNRSNTKRQAVKETDFLGGMTARPQMPIQDRLGNEHGLP